MQKKILFIWLLWCMVAQPVDKESLYNDIRTKAHSKKGKISSYLKNAGVADPQERIDVMEHCKTRAWQEAKPELRSRLHEEILYEKEPWYKRHPVVATLVTFFVTGGAVAALSELIKKK